MSAQTALKAIEKVYEKDYDKAVKFIEKGFSKDSLDPANYYATAFYLLDSNNFQIDSAHAAILKSKELLKTEEPKSVEKLAKKGLSLFTAQLLHDKIDSTAFSVAHAEGTEEAYNHFIRNYPNAHSLDSAISYRNEVAYALAIEENTPEAYQSFYNKYPDAEQVAKAKEFFEIRIYEDYTRSNKKAGYEKYLREQPRGAYVQDAIKAILHIVTANGSIRSFEEFIQLYRNSEAGEIARKLLPYLKAEDIVERITPTISQEKVAILNLSQKELLPIQIPAIDSIICSLEQNDLLLIPQKNQLKKVYTRSGKEISPQPIQDAYALKKGFYAIKSQLRNEFKIVHLSSTQLNIPPADTFALLNDRLIIAKQHNEWSIYSLLGTQLLQNIDSVWTDSSFVFLERNDKLAISTINQLAEAANQEVPALSFLYDDYEFLTETHLLLFSNDYQTLIDEHLTPKIPLAKKDIYKLEKGWLTENEDGVFLLNEDFEPFNQKPYEKIAYNNNSLALYNGTKWALMDFSSWGFPEFTYDSVQLITKFLVITYTGGDRKLHFGKKKVPLSELEKFTVLRSYNEEVLASGKEVEFVQVTNEKDYKNLYNGFGKMIWEGKSDKISAITHSIVSIEERQGKILVDSSGTKLIKPVDAIGNLSHGLIPLLKNREFGAYAVESSRRLPFKYDTRPTTYLKDSLFITTIDDKKGIVSFEETSIVPHKYDDIQFFSDSIALLTIADSISLQNIHTGKTLKTGISQLNIDDNGNLISRDLDGYGVIGKNGEVMIPFIFNDVVLKGLGKNSFYIAERRLSEVDYYVLVYYNHTGEELYKTGMTEKQYEKIVCD